MLTVLRYGLRRFRGQILGWGIGLLLLGLMMTAFYPTIVEEQALFEQLVEAYPPEFFAFFGGITDFAKPEGYLSVEFFSYMPLVLGIFGVLAGSGLLVSDEENGTLDLILSHPVSRSALFVGRLVALVVSTVAILGIGWAGLVLPTLWTTFDIGWLEVLLPLISLGLQVLVFATLALLLSMVLPSRRAAAMVTGVLLVGGYFVTSLSRIVADLEPLARVSPMTYYETVEAFDGLNLEWVVGLVAVSSVFTFLAWWQFQRRDIRVGGEGGWRLSIRGLASQLRSRVLGSRLPAEGAGSVRE